MSTGPNIQWYLDTVHGLHLSLGPSWMPPAEWLDKPRPNWRAYWTASGAVRWSTPTTPAGGRTDTTALMLLGWPRVAQLLRKSLEEPPVPPAPPTAPDDTMGVGEGDEF